MKSSTVSESSKCPTCGASVDTNPRITGANNAAFERRSAASKGPYPARIEPKGCLPSARKRSEEHTSELQSRGHLVCRLLLEKKKCDHRYLGAFGYRLYR